MRSTVAISLVVLLAFACGVDNKSANVEQQSETKIGETKTAAATSLTPEELGTLGAQIRKTPDRADALLRERGLDEKSFETAIRKVTEDPEASKRYAAAYKRAS